MTEAHNPPIVCDAPAMDSVDVVVARVGTELAAMRRAPIPTPMILWHRPPVLALQRVRGRSLADLGGSGTTAASWKAAGAVARELHEYPTSGSWRAWAENS